MNRERGNPLASFSSRIHVAVRCELLGEFGFWRGETTQPTNAVRPAEVQLLLAGEPYHRRGES